MFQSILIIPFIIETRQLSSKEDRTYDYRTMLMEEDHLYAIDNDLICLKYINNKAIFYIALTKH